MSFYSRLSAKGRREPEMEKSAWAMLGRAGSSLARGAASGTLRAGIGGALQGAAKTMANPWLSHGLTGYGIAGEFADLPGSHLAMFAGAPGWGAAFAAPSLIRSGRLATGDYSGKIEEDANSGARAAAADFLQVANRSPEVATNAQAYDQFMRHYQVPGYNPSAIRGYQTGNFGSGPSLYRQIGDVFEDPTDLMMPKLRQTIYQRLASR